MAHWQDSIREWSAAWAAVRGLETRSDGDVVVTAPDGDHAHGEYVTVFPGPEASRIAAVAARTPGTALTLVTADRNEAHAFAGDHGLLPSGTAVLLTAATETLDQEPELPEDGNLSSAALELYDVAEISVFDRPLASGRIRMADSTAVIGGITFSHDPSHTEELRSAIIAALASEAAAHGITIIYTIVDPSQVAAYTASGWTETVHILTYQAG